MPKPVFIGCMPRSGSSLLRVILNSHPRIHAGPEIHWVAGPNSKKKLFNDMSKHQDIYVNKEPKNLSRRGISKLKEFFGTNVNFVHIYRHPLDITSSYIKSIHPLEFAKSEFKKDAETFIKGMKDLMDSEFNLHEIAYEDLINNPEKSIKKLCKFIGIGFNEQMLSHHEKKHKIHNHHSDINAVKPIFNDSVKQYDKYMEYIGNEILDLCKSMNDILPIQYDSLLEKGDVVDEILGETKDVCVGEWEEDNKEHDKQISGEEDPILPIT